jgi:hypothetical protein
LGLPVAPLLLRAPARNHKKLVLVDDPGVVEDFRTRVAAGGLRGSRPVEAPAGAVRGGLARLALRSLEELAVRLSGA